MSTPKNQNYINHIAFVLDASGSMEGLREDVIKVVDAQIKNLAQRSKELDQETRITIYTFRSSEVNCLVYDKDVLRLPSIAAQYFTSGVTPLIDATIKALDDLKQTPELYGEHAFLCYVITDGQENSSKNSVASLTNRLRSLPDNWTIAGFVPNAVCLAEAKKFGFLKDNLAVWSTTGEGVEEIGETVRKTTDTFMTMRASGVKSYRNLMTLNTDSLAKASLQTNLDALKPGQFRMLTIPCDIPIADFIERSFGRPYRLGEAYYQLTKPVLVQAAKKVAIYDRKNHKVYIGDNARTMLGLPNYDVKISPENHSEFIIFIQSTSTNRKLLSGTNVLVLS